MCGALRISSSRYYRRVKQDDFPNADELHRIADTFGLNFTDLQVRLGFVTREDLEGYVGRERLSIAAAPNGMAGVVTVVSAPADEPPPTLRAAH
jgi:hypothetical protein